MDYYIREFLHRFSTCITCLKVDEETEDNVVTDCTVLYNLREHQSYFESVEQGSLTNCSDSLIHGDCSEYFHQLSPLIIHQEIIFAYRNQMNM